MDKDTEERILRDLLNGTDIHVYRMFCKDVRKFLNKEDILYDEDVYSDYSIFRKKPYKVVNWDLDPDLKEEIVSNTSNILNEVREDRKTMLTQEALRDIFRELAEGKEVKVDYADYQQVREHLDRRGMDFEVDIYYNGSQYLLRKNKQFMKDKYKEAVRAIWSNKDMHPAYKDRNQSIWNGQVSGSHYKDFEIQPAEFIQKNRLNWFEGNVVKYICRHAMKNGQKDVEKVLHYVIMLLEDTYGQSKEDVVSIVEELYGKPESNRNDGKSKIG